MRSLLPINSLRNAAMLAADTDMVAMIDVDLLISRDLSRDMMMIGGTESRQEMC
jgi:glycosyltransferase-like protein LARGE